MEWLEWLKVLAPIVTLLVSALLSVVAFLGKAMLKGMVEENRNTRTELTNHAESSRQRHEELEKDFLKWQAQLPRFYVLKDDYIRHLTIVEKKIDDHANTTQRALSTIDSDIKQLLRESPKRTADGQT